MQLDDIERVSLMQYSAWHEYYSQYVDLYRVISGAVTQKGLHNEWTAFLDPTVRSDSGLISGGDKHAFIALIDDEVVGVGAVSAYVEGKWPEVDNILRLENGELPKVAKFQDLYISADRRGSGLGHQLTLVRADTMLSLGYSAIFLTTYADAHKSNQFHLKTNLTRVHDYISMQTFAEGQRVKIACFLNTDLKNYRDCLEQHLLNRVKQGKILIN